MKREEKHDPSNPPALDLTRGVVRLLCLRCGRKFWPGRANLEAGRAPVCCPYRDCKARLWWVKPIYKRVVEERSGERGASLLELGIVLALVALVAIGLLALSAEGDKNRSARSVNAETLPGTGAYPLTRVRIPSGWIYRAEGPGGQPALVYVEDPPACAVELEQRTERGGAQ